MSKHDSRILTPKGTLNHMSAIGGHQKPYAGATNDWITPRGILERLGPFDLDPCACIPQPWRTAARMLTTADDGLAHQWRGRVWLNPPYGPDTGKWLARLAEHDDGIALVFARTETAMFFDHVWGKASAVLFIKGRLHFHYPDGSRAKMNSGAPSVLIAYGSANAERLRDSGIEGAILGIAGQQC